MRLSVGAAPALIAVLLFSLDARPEEGGAPAPAPIVLDRLVGGDGYLAPLLQHSRWRPGTTEVTHLRKDVLHAHDAATGRERVVLRLTDLDGALDPKAKAVPMRGIGREGPAPYHWTPKGDAVVVARKGDLFRHDLASGAWVRLTKTRASISDVRLAPDGERLAFARGFDLWAVVRSAEGWKTIRLTQGGNDDERNAGLDWLYPEELGCQTGIWWSPDSRRVAFLRLDEREVPRFPLVDDLQSPARFEAQPYPLPGDRNPAPSVGVVGLDGGPPVWMRLPPGAEYVPWVAWTRDGSGLLVATVDRPQRKMTLLLADAATGDSRPLLVEEEPDGWIEPPDPPLVLRTRDALVWRRPHEGFWRPMLVDYAGEEPGRARALTKGAFDVDRLVALDADESALFYEGGGGDATRRALWRVGIVGSDPVAVGPSDGWHRVDFDEGRRFYLDAHSTAARAPRHTVFRVDGTAAATLADAETVELRALRLEPPEIGRIERDGSPALHTKLRRPARFDPTRRYPVVVFVYGGPHARTVRDEWDSLFGALLAQDGFAVWSLDNRGSSGCGRAFETAVCERLGRLELEDQLAGVERLKALPWVDGSRVGIWGWSYGGTMACLAMARAPGTFRAGAAVAPVTDWRLYDSIYTERYLGLPAENAAGYREGSPLAHVKGLAGPLLLCHGLHDDNVHFQNTAQMVDALLREKKPFDLMAYPGRGHGIEGPAARRDVFTRIREHFRRHLRPDAPR